MITTNDELQRAVIAHAVRAGDEAKKALPGVHYSDDRMKEWLVAWHNASAETARLRKLMTVAIDARLEAEKAGLVGVGIITHVDKAVAEAAAKA